ncbi:hypothetical protein ACC699_34295 [Rhizobium ruizarguesonis]
MKNTHQSPRPQPRQPLEHPHLERMSYDIAVSEYSAIILRRAAKLVGTVEGLVEREAKLAVLH